MQELIKIEVKEFQNEKTNSTSARELWKSLGVNKKFTDWITVQIKRGLFDENIDYLVFHQKGKNPNGGRPSIEYYLTLDTAKEIAMMSGTAKGKEVRNYFIKVEKEFFKMREFIHNQTLDEKVVNLNESKVREAFFIAFDGKCYYTNENLSKSHFHIDHILPKSKGGQDYLSNLVVCKPKVNQIKSDSYDENFVAHHQAIVSKKFAPKVKSILDLVEKNRQDFDPKYLLNGSVMNKLENLYGRESIKELYSKIIPDLNYKKSQKIETKTTEYFIENCVVKSDGERLPTIKLYEYYLDFCENNQISPYGKIRFFKLFRYMKRVPNMEDLKMSFFDNKKQRYFKNLEVIG